MHGERSGFFRGGWFSAALVLAFVLAPSCAHAARVWNTLTTPRFVVVSQLGERQTRAWAADFSQFIGSLRAVIKVDERNLPSLTVVLFAEERSFDSYKPARPNGKRADEIAGLFYSRRTWGVIGLARRVSNADTQRLIQHEGVHWYMSADTRDYPMWLEEGLAEVFSTFNVAAGEIRWGDLIPWHVFWLQSDKLFPLERLLHVSRTSEFFNDAERTDLFYAQSWGLAHYMLFGKRDGERTQLDAYVEAWRRGENPDEAFRTAFGRDYAAMDAELGRYLHNGSFWLRKKKALKVSTTGWRFAPAETFDVDVALARLALGGGRHRMADAQIIAAIAHARGRPEGYELLTMLERDRVGESTAANSRVLAAAEKAIAHGSGDGQIHEMAATEKWRAATELGGVSGSEARVIADIYERAITLRPTLLVAYKNLANIIAQAEPLRPRDMQILDGGHAAFPDEGTILVGLAACADRNGDRSAARQLLEEASAGGRGNSAETMRTVKEMQSRWMQQEHFDRVEAAKKARKFDEALAAFDELIALTDDFAARVSFTNQRRGLLQECLVGAVDDAIVAGKIEFARARIVELLRSDELRPTARRYLRSRLVSIGGVPDDPPAEIVGNVSAAAATTTVEN